MTYPPAQDPYGQSPYGGQQQNPYAGQSPYGGPPSYGAPQAYPQQEESKTLPIVALVFGVLGFFGCVCVGPIVAAVCGWLGYSKSNVANNKGLALAGFILGVVQLVYYLIYILLYLVLGVALFSAAHSGGSGSYSGS